MTGRSAQRAWLDIVDGRAPILLIAPHGGRAGERGRAALHPKVNDLQTAEITRELARRLEASALINHGMDRNELDCNRLSQLIENEPWLLTMIADRVERMIARWRRITVLLIHGWNIIEPRIDLGLGARLIQNRLQAPRGAQLSASDHFIRHEVDRLAALLRDVGITPTFGLRYPGAGAQNLLQAFTPRFASSDQEALRRLAAAAAGQQIDALQLELSVALRLAGPLHDRALDAISRTFTPGVTAAESSAELEIVRIPRAAPPKRGKAGAAPVPPVRIGVEFYDPKLRIGGIASFDFGPNAAGGRIMMLTEQRRVALFTGEGGAVRRGNCVSLGPLALDTDRQSAGLRFRGPAVVVDDGAAYLSVEGALAGARLDPAMEIETSLDLESGGPDFASLLARFEDQENDGHSLPSAIEVTMHPQAGFGRITGRLRFCGRTHELNGIARVGASFTGLGPRNFVTRRMLWARPLDQGCNPALEIRSLGLDGAPPLQSAFVRSRGRWISGEIRNLSLQNDSPHHPPGPIEGVIDCNAEAITIIGDAQTFMSLSRPGFDGSRIRTSLGFASYLINGEPAAGMYEYSVRSEGAMPAEGDDEQ